MNHKHLTQPEIRARIKERIAHLANGLPELSRDQNPQIVGLVAHLRGQITALEDVDQLLSGARTSFIY